MVSKLDDLLSDGRLARLFSPDARHCALQLWILQIKCGQSTENRVVYGRLLPYNHSSDSWSYSNNDNFHTFGQFRAKVTRINLYIRSNLCAELLRLLSSGCSIAAVSQNLGLKKSDSFNARFGETSLGAGNQIHRPVSYLLNRDAHDRQSISSPHGAAGAFSASITQSDKKSLFRLGEDYGTALTAMVIEHLNAETGLDFGGTDIPRFGDLELLVFPTLDDREQCLLDVSWVDSPHALFVRFNPIQVPHFSGFQFRLCIANDGQVSYSSLANAERDEAGEFVCKFELSEQLRERTDSTELEVFGFHSDQTNGGLLCCRWRVGYIRELNFQGHVMNHGIGQVKFDWLEKTVRPTMSARAKAALTIHRGDPGFGSRIGGREADPWVPVNRDLISLFSRLHPPKSEGLFLLRWGKEDPESRLQLLEWLKKLLVNYRQHQIVIFDPYFDDAGLGLILLCASQDSDFLVFRSLPKKPSKESEVATGESEEPTPRGIDNLLKNCEHNQHLMSGFNLRILGLKELHDRYILIIGADGLPIKGFNLSNSLQYAAENYPLLITPIPADILLRVDKYKTKLVQEAKASQHRDNAEKPSISPLFDSTASPTVRQNHEHLHFLESHNAGDVLSRWFGELSLKGLSGDSLKARMSILDLLKDGSLALSVETGIKNCLLQKAGDFTDFAATWKLIGDVIAHSNIEEFRLELESDLNLGFLELLARFFEESLNRAYDGLSREVAITDTRFFQMPVDTLLNSSYHPHHFFHATKYAVLTWAEYYTIKFLWWHAPDTLLSVVEAQMICVPIDPQGQDVVRLSLLNQVVSEISLSVQFDISATQRDRLLKSSNGLLQWMGLNAIEILLERPGGITAVLELMASFVYLERVRALGWMVHHAARNPQKTDNYNALVAALHDALPADIPAEELNRLVNSMRGHMQQLALVDPWLFQDVVLPLLQHHRANYDDACEIWVQELTSMLEPKLIDQSLLFERAREGQTTNISAFLFAYSSPTRQQASLKSLQEILKRQQRVIQQPLPSTSNWARWDRALTVSLWILAFSRWGKFYLRQRNMTDHELERLSSSARELAMIRQMSEWRSNATGRPGELAAFLDQVDELLRQSDSSDPE